MSSESPFSSEQDPRRRPARMALYVGTASILLGVVVLYLGYNGTATNTLIQAQIPYIVSGGLVGLALVVLGGIAIALHVLLQVQADFRVELAALRDAIGGAQSPFGAPTLAMQAPSANGSVMVAKGASSFHKPDCRLVSRAEEARPVPRAEAESAGLTPCRICKP
jgi:hypothetical protein